MRANPIIVDFSKGLNTQDSAKNLQDGECQVAQDCNLDQIGTVFSRKFNVNYLSFNSKPRTIFPYSNLLTHLENGKIFNIATQIGSGYGSNRFSCLEYNNIWYATNVDNQIRYNGSGDIDTIGNTEPAAKPTVADASESGDLDGTYYYKYTYVDENGKESSISPVSDAVTVSDSKINVTVAASADPKIDSINIHRLGGTLTDWYFVANTTNTNHAYKDETGDNSLSTLSDADYNDAPPALNYIAEHYQRLIGARTSTYPNSIWWTVLYEPEYWGSNVSYQYLLGNDKYCTGLLPWGRVVLFFKLSEIYVMEGVAPATWHKRRASSKVGNVSPFALSYYQMPIFCAFKGLFQFDGYNERELSRKIRNFFDTNSSLLSDAVGEVFNKKYYFGLEDKTLIYDFEFKRFIIYNFGLSALSFDSVNDILYGGVNNNVVKLEQDLNDSEETVNFHLKSKAYLLGRYPGEIREITDYLLQIDTKGEDVTFNIYIDYNLKQTIILNTKVLQSIERNTNTTLKGSFIEIEFIYDGTKQIQIELPIIFNRIKDE